MKKGIAWLLVLFILLNGFTLLGSAETVPAVNYLLSNCDKQNGWSTEAANGTMSLSSEAVVGTQSVQVKCSNQMFFYFISQNGPMDFTNVTHLDFWFYTEDVNIFNYGDCGFNLSYDTGWTSGGAKVSRATLKALTLENGWNHLYVPIDYSNTTAEFDITIIQRFRFYSVGLPTDTAYTVRIDDVRAVNEAGLAEIDRSVALPVEQAIDKIGTVNSFSRVFIENAREQYDALTDTQKALVANYAVLTKAEADLQQLLAPTKTVLISNCDTTDYWSGGVSVDTAEYKEGTGSLKQTADDMMVYYKNANGIDLTGMTHIEFDFYTSDANIFKEYDCSMNFASVTTGSWWDSDRGLAVNRSDLKNLTIQEGWNTIKVPLTAVSEPAESFDITKVTSIRFYALKQVTGSYYRIDNFRATGPAGEATVVLPEDMEQKPALSGEENTWMITSCDDTMPLTLSNTADSQVVTVGEDDFTAFVGLNASGALTVSGGSLSSNPISITDYTTEDLALRVQFYVSDVSAINTAKAQFELTSSGRPDVNELAWGLSNMNLQNGWNDLYLPFDNGASSNVPLDITKINYMRFYMYMSGDAIMAFDDIKIVKCSTPELNEDFSNADSLAKWESDATLSLENEMLKVQGNGTVKVSAFGYEIPILSPENTPIYLNLQAIDSGAVSSLTVTVTDSASHNATADLDVSQLQSGSFTKFMVVPSEMTAENGFSFANASTLSVTAVLTEEATLLLDNVQIIVREGYWWRDWLYDYTVEPGEFSIAVIPDIQELTRTYPAKLNQLMQWLVDNKEKENIQFTIDVGDLTWNGNAEGTAAVTQFTTASQAFNMLEDAGMEYSICYGNHDYINETRDTTLLNEYFPYSELSAFDSFGGTMVDGTVDNLYYCLKIQDIQYLILALEYNPTAATLEWANQVVEDHPTSNVIVTTHGYMSTTYGERLSMGDAIWNTFVSKHENIFMVICGHEWITNDPGSMNFRVDQGEKGNTVYQVMANAQDIDVQRGGVGILLMMRFRDGGRTIDFNYFSPVNDGLAYKEVNQFAVTLPEGQLIVDEQIEPQPPAPAYGDLNGDDAVDAKDALMILQAAVDKITLTEEQTVIADVNGDKAIDAKDALLVLQKAVEKIDKFPVEE